MLKVPQGRLHTLVFVSDSLGTIAFYTCTFTSSPFLVGSKKCQIEYFSVSHFLCCRCFFFFRGFPTSFICVLCHAKRIVFFWCSHLLLDWDEEKPLQQRIPNHRWRDWNMEEKSSHFSEKYCWWLKSCTVYPIIYKVWWIPGGAGFLPSTVGNGG